MNDYMLEAIGQSIRTTRQQLEMSQQTLAELLSTGRRGVVSQAYISQIEHGKPFSWQRLVDISVALGVKTSKLIELAENLR